MPVKFSDDTIFALSTGFGKAAIAVIRVSGHECANILRQVCPRAVFPARQAVFSAIHDRSDKILDRALVLSFPAPRSFTGEDMIEFQVSGSRAVIVGLMGVIASFPGTRPADPGEFARRAFENGKLDLVEVEGLASLVAAETRAQLDHAMRVMGGELSRRSEDVRGLLLQSMAILESAIDFSDTEDAADLCVDQILPSVSQAHDVLADLLQNSGVSERLRDGMTVVIAGPPNVGKSTLLNFIANRDVAIVSSIAGTTRDSLQVAMEIGGFPVNFVDTAGLRKTEDPVEALGVALSRTWSERADLILWLCDREALPTPVEFLNKTVIKVRTKTDLDTDVESISDALRISAKTGAGIANLIERVSDFAQMHFEGVGQLSFCSARQNSAAGDAQSALRNILLRPDRGEELIAEDLRLAVHAMSRLTGRIEVEEVLGEIFSRLCVGK